MPVSTNCLEQDAIVVCVAPNGARRTRVDHDRIPLTAEELGREALACVTAGAQVMHLHVRDSQGAHSLDPDIYRSAISSIREFVGTRLVIQVTTEAVGKYAPSDQMAVIRELRPEAFSVAIRELIPDEGWEGAVADFLQFVAREGIGVQFILHAPSEVARLRALVERGVVPVMPLHGLFVLGSYRDQTPSKPRSILAFLSGWPDDWPWTVCAFGNSEAQCLAGAVALGGHVRVGFENNLWNPDGSLAPSNAALIRNICEIVDRTGRRRADIHEARRLYASGSCIGVEATERYGR